MDAETKPLDMHRCDACGELHRYQDLSGIEDLDSRLQPGSIVPSGECPACGCLCYPDDDQLTEVTLSVLNKFARLDPSTCRRMLKAEYAVDASIYEKSDVRPCTYGTLGARSATHPDNYHAVGMMSVINAILQANGGKTIEAFPDSGDPNVIGFKIIE